MGRIGTAHRAEATRGTRKAGALFDWPHPTWVGRGKSRVITVGKLFSEIKRPWHLEVQGRPHPCASTTSGAPGYQDTGGYSTITRHWNQARLPLSQLAKLELELMVEETDCPLGRIFLRLLAKKNAAAAEHVREQNAREVASALSIARISLRGNTTRSKG